MSSLRRGDTSFRSIVNRHPVTVGWLLAGVLVTAGLRWLA